MSKVHDRESDTVGTATWVDSTSAESPDGLPMGIDECDDETMAAWKVSDACGSKVTVIRACTAPVVWWSSLGSLAIDDVVPNESDCPVACTCDN